MRRLVLLVALTLATLLAAASVVLAQGTERTVRVTGGNTLLQVNSGTADALSDAGIRVRAIGDASGSAPVFRFPITGGRVQTNLLGGNIRHSGGLSFSRRGNRLGVSNFIINLNRGVLTARVRGTNQRVPLLRLSGGDARVRRNVVTLTDVRARLTRQAATALNDTLNTRVFRGGLLIGEANVVANTRR